MPSFSRSRSSVQAGVCFARPDLSRCSALSGVKPQMGHLTRYDATAFDRALIAAHIPLFIKDLDESAPCDPWNAACFTLCRHNEVIMWFALLRLGG